MVNFNAMDIVQMVVTIAVLVAIVLFLIVLQALWAPKVSLVRQAPNAQRLQQLTGVQKKKQKARGAGATKKNKKAHRAGAINLAPEMEAICEPEFDVGRVRTPSDVEAPSVKSAGTAIEEKALSAGVVFAQICAGVESPAEVESDEDESDCEPMDITICTDVASCVVDGDFLEASELRMPWEAQVEVIHKSTEEARGVCEMPDVQSWGCPVQRTYTSSLLLMHREIQRTIARGAPGLEPQAAHLPTYSVCMRSMQEL